MLWSASTINGYAIAASDGQLGAVSDFLFDDASWSVRWLVVDTGGWLSGRKVLVPPSALGRPNQKVREFSVRLSKQQIKDSPDIEADRPVSRQMETAVYDYYGWTPYWDDGIVTDGYGYTGIAAAMPPLFGSGGREADIAEARGNKDDPHLRSVNAVIGYHIHASDGELGHVEGFLLEDPGWSIRYLVVNTKNWWRGQSVLISPRSAQDSDWAHRRVNLNVDRQAVKDSPLHDASVAVGLDYEQLP